MMNVESKSEDAYDGRGAALEEIEVLRTAAASWQIVMQLLITLPALRPMIKAAAQDKPLADEGQLVTVLAMDSHDNAMRNLGKLLDRKVGKDQLELLCSPGFAAYLEKQMADPKCRAEFQAEVERQATAGE